MTDDYKWARDLLFNCCWWVKWKDGNYNQRKFGPFDIETAQRTMSQMLIGAAGTEIGVPYECSLEVTGRVEIRHFMESGVVVAIHEANEA